MRKRILVLWCAALAVALTGCSIGKGIKGSGNRKAEKRELPAFKAIDTTGAYEVEVMCQKPASFEIEADDNILPLIKTEVRDGVLYVTSEKRYSSSRSVALRISLPELIAVSSRGAGEITLQDAKSDDLRIESMGVASIKADGKVKTGTISSTGAGDIDASRLQAEKARVTVTGAASVNVYATDQLEVTVSGAGSVTYSGNPKSVNKNVSGIGSVNKKEE
ncbi:MAG TPA: head GIN domain-containing protein [Pyrinomonadaceae bacterium]|nr:head GIN domain-containing protein [Pyrinomonadaceae bacterium]